MVRAITSPMLESSNALLVLFFTMHYLGWIGTLLILTTALLSTNVHRHVTWTNLCLAWIVSCFGYSLLLTTGQLFKSTPDFSVCLVQAAAVYATPALTTGATLSLAIHLWLTFRTISETPTARTDAIYSILLVAVPYFAPIGLFIGVFVYGLQYPSRVLLSESKMYCGVDSTIPGKISAIYVAILVFPTVILEGLVIITLYRNWKGYNRTARNGLRTVVRFSAFTISGIFAISISLSYLSSRSYGRLPNVLMALPPVTFVAVFGSQMASLDLMRAWLFWRRQPVSRDAEKF
ncbi:hypothetical protein C8J56DRAFT_1128378 [Mycena floridula]|nr:hypothetical protein C8J56DRAFT_1128378 [Mycena floridula]